MFVCIVSGVCQLDPENYGAETRDGLEISLTGENSLTLLCVSGLDRLWQIGLYSLGLGLTLVRKPAQTVLMHD